MSGKSGQLLGVLVGAVVLAVVALAVLSRRPPADLLVLKPVERVPLGPGLDGSGLSRRQRRAPAGNAALRGIVLAGGRPVVAEVTLHRRADSSRLGPAIASTSMEFVSGPEARRPPATTSTEDGTFAFAHVVRGAYVLAARSAEGGYGRLRVEVEGDAGPVHRLELSPADLRLHGTVRDQHGAPYGQSISAVASEDWPLGGAEAGRSAISSDGRFEIDGLTAGYWALLVEAEGVAGAVAVGINAPQPGALDLRVRRPELTVPVRVVEALGGAPVVGAVVEAVWLARGVIVFQRAISDGEGRVAIAAVPDADLVAAADGYPPAGSKIGSEPREITIALRRASRLVGRALRVGTQEGVPGLTVQVRPTDCDPVTTDGQGRYVIEGVPPGHLDVVAHGPGWISLGVSQAKEEGWNPLAIDVLAGVEVTHDLFVEPAARVSGRVQDPSGAPIVGARVGLLMSFAPLLDAPTPVTSDGEGRYSFEGLPPQGSIALVATAEGWDGRAGRATTLQPGPNTIDLTLDPASWLDVRVLSGGDGSPLQGAQITVGRPGIGGLEVMTDAAGRVRVGPTGGAKWIHVEAVGHVGVSLDALPTSPYEVRLEPGLPLAGRVVDAEGQPAPVGTPVRASCLDAVSDPAAVHTDVEGRFVFTPVAPGTWTIRVGGFPELGSVEAEAGREDVVVRLESQPAKEAEVGLPLVRVRVRSSDREPVASGRVALLRTGETREAGFEGAEASLLLPGRSTREPFHVVVWGARDEAGVLHGPASAGPFPPDTRDVEVRLPPASTLLGRVEGLPPELVRGVVVDAYPYLGTWGWNDFLGTLPKGIEQLELPKDGKLTARCAADGSFRLGGLAERPFALVALLPPGWYQEDEEIGEPGEYARLRVKRGVDVTVTVLGESGEPLPGVDVRAHYDVDHPPHERPLYDAHQAWSKVSTDREGRVRLVGLRARATYRLRADPRGDQEYFDHFKGDWQPRDTVLRLQRSYSIEGVVRDRSGKPVESAHLALWVNGKQKHASTEDDGRFRFSGLEPGTYAVVAGASFDVLPDEPPADAPRFAAGTKDVVLVIDPGVELLVEGVGGADGEARTIEVYTRKEDGLESIVASTRDQGPASVRILGLEGGRPYTLFVEPDRDDTRYGLLEVPDESKGPVTMRLQTGAKVRLRFEGHTGLPEFTYVFASSKEGLRMSAVVDATGTAHGFPPGTWNVRVETRGEHLGRCRGSVSVGTTDTEVLLHREDR